MQVEIPAAVAITVAVAAAAVAEAGETESLSFGRNLLSRVRISDPSAQGRRRVRVGGPAECSTAHRVQ